MAHASRLGRAILKHDNGFPSRVKLRTTISDINLSEVNRGNESDLAHGALWNPSALCRPLNVNCSGSLDGRSARRIVFAFNPRVTNEKGRSTRSAPELSEAVPSPPPTFAPDFSNEKGKAVLELKDL